MKTIFRVRLTKGFTTLPNDLLRDKRMSFKARGILAMILSHAEDWSVNTGWLEEQGTDGRASIKSGLDELKALGYAKFERLHDDRGNLSGTVWIFTDQPTNDDQPNGRELSKINTDLQVSCESGNMRIAKPSTSEELFWTEDHCTEEKKAEASPSAHHELIRKWSEAFEGKFKRKYFFQSAKDAAAAKAILKIEPDPDRVVQVATKAWANLKNDFLLNQSFTLAGLASKWNEIRYSADKPRKCY